MTFYDLFAIIPTKKFESMCEFQLKNTIWRKHLSNFSDTFSKEKNIISDKRSSKDFEHTIYKSLRERLRESYDPCIKSIYRLGRNKEVIKNELRYFKDKSIIVHILNFPQIMINVDCEHQKSIMEFVNNLPIEVFSFMTIFGGDNLTGLLFGKRPARLKRENPMIVPKFRSL